MPVERIGGKSVNKKMLLDEDQKRYDLLQVINLYINEERFLLFAAT